MSTWVRWFREVGRGDVALVGGKNASLGEMLQHLEALGVNVPDGFALTAAAYRDFLRENGLEAVLTAELAGALEDEALQRASARVRERILAGRFPEALRREVLEAYARLSEGEPVPVAVRSSATAEDLPTASFAGQQESFLHVRGAEALLDAVQRCWASLFSPRAIHYRQDMGFGQLDVALSVGVQRMVRADEACAGVMFTLDTESGFRDLVLVTSSWGLGENVVQGRVGPDEFRVHKPTLRQGHASLVGRTLGRKELRLAWSPAAQRLENRQVPPEEQARWSLSDEEVLQLARWGVAIEDHYATPMDIEWAKDGPTGQLFVVQARPETVHSQRQGQRLRLWSVQAKGLRPLVEGLAVGGGVAQGSARVIRDVRHIARFQAGEVLVTESTDPDWEPVLKRAAGIVTERGGRTSHAAIVARELGIPAVVGAPGACAALQDGQAVTLSCAEGELGRVYAGQVPFQVEEVDPATLARSRTRVYLNLANPEQAFHAAQLPADGVGLLRMEFVFAGRVKVHPLAITRYATLPAETRWQIDELARGFPSREEFLVRTLAEGIGTIAAAFHPRPVVLRFSDFKTNEYAHLLGGAGFEPEEENPMLGWRGASRYYHPEYKEGFLLEVAAVRRVREQMGLTNLQVMIPFCRTPEEGRRVIAAMREGGLVQGQGGLEVWVMAEIPSNVLLAEEFAQLFDGFSIGSNDLTQLVLGVDRDSTRVAPLFDERNGAVKRACAMLIETAHRCGRKVSICGQAPSDYPDFAAFLVQTGIDSLSLTADSLVKTLRRVVEVERELGRGPR
jgi:pyruvate,water dikinase